MKERAEMIAQRRGAEDADDLTLFLGTPPSLQPKEDEIDELGRVVPSANSPTARANRTAAREARKLRRRASNQNPGQKQVEEDGYSTDSSLPSSDAEDYRTAIVKLLGDGKTFMADVKAEEFKDPNLGLGKWFGEWRAKFSDIYTGAWGGLGMVGAWEFWVRLEILGWSPVEVRYATSRSCAGVSVLTWTGSAPTQPRLVQLVQVPVQVLAPSCA